MSGDGSDLPIEEDPLRQDHEPYDIHDPGQWFGAVLLADEIEHYCTKATPRMIDPFSERQLRPAAYTLTLGRDIHIGGEDAKLDEKKPTFLKPHQVAVVSTIETLSVPRFLIARWSLRVRTIYEGLLWTGGPQVDPGWQGRLYCPIYNLSERVVELKAGKDFFTIDFVRTTALTPEYLALRGKEGSRTWFPSRPLADPLTLEQHDKHRLRSAPYETLRVVGELIDFKTTVQASMAILFAVLGGIIAALAFITTRGFTDQGGDPFDWWFVAVGAIAVGSFIFSLAALFLTWTTFLMLRRFRR